jgi:hypothetical protein
MASICCSPPDSVPAAYPGLEDFMIHWAEGLPPREFKEQLR